MGGVGEGGGGGSVSGVRAAGASLPAGAGAGRVTAGCGCAGAAMLARVSGRLTLLDVHAPHEKIHGVGDFFLHLFTITIGLLIALGLEAFAERVHHHHQRDEADANLRHELADNRRELKTTVDAIPAEITNLLQILQLLRERAEKKPVTATSVRLGVHDGLVQQRGLADGVGDGRDQLHGVRAREGVCGGVPGAGGV